MLSVDNDGAVTFVRGVGWRYPGIMMSHCRAEGRVTARTAESYRRRFVRLPPLPPRVAMTAWGSHPPSGILVTLVQGRTGRAIETRVIDSREALSQDEIDPPAAKSAEDTHYAFRISGRKAAPLDTSKIQNLGSLLKATDLHKFATDIEKSAGARNWIDAKPE